MTAVCNRPIIELRDRKAFICKDETTGGTSGRVRMQPSPNGDWWLLHSLYVQEEYRGQGIGSSLVNHVNDVNVVLHCRPHLIGWYESLGFTDKGPVSPLSLPCYSGNGNELMIDWEAIIEPPAEPHDPRFDPHLMMRLATR